MAPFLMGCNKVYGTIACATHEGGLQHQGRDIVAGLELAAVRAIAGRGGVVVDARIKAAGAS
jgi:hypothetical protein